MSNRNQANLSSTRVGVGTRFKGVFETAHGIGENIRGRTLGAIDDITRSGSAESKSYHTSLADRGRLEAETGMAHISGYADPNAYLGRSSNSIARAHGHTTEAGPGRGYVRAEEDDYYGGGGRVDGGVGRWPGGYGTDDRHGQPGVQGSESERQQPVIDPGNTTRMGPIPDDKPNSGPPQNVGSEAGWTSIPQSHSPTQQQRVKRDFPPELPPRPQTHTVDDDRHGQMYQ